MITRLFANNFRCLVNFGAEFDSFGVLCGPNGSGKSSVFDALQLIRNLGTGDGLLGGEGEKDIPVLEFTNWQKSTTQEFELGMTVKGLSFEYIIHIEQKAHYEKPRITKEQVMCNKKTLFDRDLEGVRFQKANGEQTGFPLDWRQAALASIQPKGSISELAILQESLAKLLILRPNPRGMVGESKSEAKHPNLYMTNILSWYRSLSQDQDWLNALGGALRDIWPDFKSFRQMDAGMNTKALQLRFDGTNFAGSGELMFNQLSDGEKALIALYMIRTAMETGAAHTVLIDEPDNFIGLPELQPWVLSLRELLDEDHQAILISHHPEILSNSTEESGRYLSRENHTSPTRIDPLKIPEGLTAGEAMARGWI
jgi:ABC-type cobalamin/Fe3+-siderophores transport system ATPase subunit